MKTASWVAPYNYIGHITVILRVCLGRPSRPVLLFPVTVKLLVSTLIAGCWFSRLPQVCRVGLGNRASEDVSTIIISIKIYTFFLNKYSSDCCKLLIIMEFSKKVESNTLESIITAFPEKNFQILLFCHFCFYMQTYKHIKNMLYKTYFYNILS